MVPISDALRTSLDALNSQIRDAELFLRKQPGADKASVQLEEDVWGPGAYLEVQRDSEGDCQICVCRYDVSSHGDSKLLEDYSVSNRIELCEFIPDLLDSAVEAQEQVAKEANEAANAIQQALARVREK